MTQIANPEQQPGSSAVARGYWFALACISSVWGGLITLGALLDMFGTSTRLMLADGIVTLCVAASGGLILLSDRFRQRLWLVDTWLWQSLAVLAAVISVALLFQAFSTNLLVYNAVVCGQLAIGFALLPHLKAGYHQAQDTIWVWIYLTLILLLGFAWLNVVNRPLTSPSILYNSLPGIILVTSFALLTGAEVIRQLLLAQAAKPTDATTSINQLDNDLARLPLPVLLIDYEGKVITTNGSGLRWNSAEASTLVGRHIHCWLSEDDWQTLRLSLQRQPDHFSYRTQWINEDRKCVIDLNISRRGEYWVVLIIEQQELSLVQQQLQQVVVARDNLGYIVDHHLQPPVQAMQQQLLEISDQTDDAVCKERLQQLLSAMRQWLRLLQETQAYVLLDRHQLHARSCNLEDISQQVGTEYHERLQHLRASLQINVNHKVVGDSGLLYELAKQLVSNSLKFHAPQRRLQLQIYTQRLGSNKVAWCFADNGQGFKNHHAKRLLKPFSRGQGVETIAGSGMGLALVDKIVDLHHGMLTIESSPEQGCLIKVVLTQAAEG